MLAVFGITIFLGAALLFIAELMFAKMVLPLLGGTPAVWNTCTVFFQASLLAGYYYAHAVTTRIKIERQLLLHSALFIVPILFLPISISAGWTPPTGKNPIFDLLVLLTVSIGLPFVMVSTTAPLIQRWFSVTGHGAGEDPYFLYAASNAGGFAGLVGYVVLLEPNFTRTMISELWKYGYMLLVVLTVLCAVSVYRSRRGKLPEDVREKKDKGADIEKIDRFRVVRWMLLAAVPASLLLGLTTFITTDIMAVPLLWVLPLSIYLLTYIMAFSRRTWILRKALWVMLPIFAVIQTLFLTFPGRGSIIPISIKTCFHMTTFFLVALACHSDLAKDRPGTGNLTKYYLLISLGGVLGGAFNALVAPVVFQSVIEYPAMLVIAYILTVYPAASEKRGVKKKDKKKGRVKTWKTDVLWIASVTAAAFLGMIVLKRSAPDQIAQYYVVLSAIGLIMISGIFRRYRFGIALGICMVLLNTVGLESSLGQIVYRERTFYGLTRVHRWVSQSQSAKILMNGTTCHGFQFQGDESRRIPTTYYSFNGPLGDIFGFVRNDSAPERVGVIGLGAGTIACYAGRNDTVKFYEIDPAVARVALDPRYFTYLEDATDRGANLDLTMGDGRLTVAKEPEGYFDLLIVDAFGSDSVPTHLLTTEALGMYMGKVRPGGIVAMNITNHNADISSVLGNTASSVGLAVYIRRDKGDYTDERTPSIWVAMSRNPSEIEGLAANEGWSPLEKDERYRPWTDDYSNILQVLNWKLDFD